MRTMLVELKPREERKYARSDTFEKRKWWPVYVKNHRDPDLGTLGQQLHHHIAFNRFTGKFLRKHRQLARIAVIVAEDILGYRMVDTPIKSRPAFHVNRATRTTMIANWKKRRKTKGQGELFV